MVRAIGDQPQESGRRGVFHKYGRHHREIGKMCAPAIGIIDHGHIARRQRQRLKAGLHRQRHGSKMNGDMRRLRDQISGCIKHRTGKITAFFNVGREGGPLQASAHFLGHGHQPVLHHFSANGIIHRWLLP